MTTYIRRIDDSWAFMLASLTVVTLALLAIYATSYFSMVQIWWRSGTFTHGFFILPISLYMVWHRRERLAVIEPNIDYRALYAVMIIGPLWLLADLSNVLVVKQFSVTALIPVMVWFLFGKRILYALSFPLFYLFFSVPVGEFLVPKLQDITAWFSVLGLQLINMPVYWEGRYISIPSGDFVVAEACSGIRYLIASVALGALYAYISYESIYRRMAFIALSIVVPIFANALRAFGIIMIAHLSDMKLATGIDHFIYGWLFFGLVMFFLFWLGNQFREPVESLPDRGKSNNKFKLSGEHRKKIIKAIGLVLLCAAIWPTISLTAQLNQKPVKTRLVLPEITGDWRGPAQLNFPWAPKFHNVTHEVQGTYMGSGHQVMIYLAYYGNQNQDAELINSENKFYGFRWRRTGEKLHTVQVNGTQIDLHQTFLRRGERKLLVAHYYRIGKKLTVNKILAKMYEAKNRLTADSSGSYAVVIASTFDVSVTEAEKSVEKFLQENYQALERVMQ